MTNVDKGAQVYAAYRGEQYVYSGTKVELATHLGLTVGQLNLAACRRNRERVDKAKEKGRGLALFFIGYANEILEDCAV